MNLLQITKSFPKYRKWDTQPISNKYKVIFPPSFWSTSNSVSPLKIHLQSHEVVNWSTAQIKADTVVSQSSMRLDRNCNLILTALSFKSFLKVFWVYFRARRYWVQMHQFIRQFLYTLAAKRPQISNGKCFQVKTCFSMKNTQKTPQCSWRFNAKQDDLRS